MAGVCTVAVLGLHLGPDRGSSRGFASEAAVAAVLVLVWAAGWLLARMSDRDRERARRGALGAAELQRSALASTGLANAILAGSSDCIIELSLDGCVRSVNDAGLAFLDIGDVETCRAVPIEDLCSEGVRDAVRRLVVGAGEGRLGQVMAPCLTANGNSRWWELTVSPVLGADARPASLIGIGRDVTARWAAEQAREEAIEAARLATRAKSEFLATMSHEIRTPLNGVLGAASFLLTTHGLTDEQRRMLRLQQDAGRMLLAVINDILDWTKIEEGRVEIEYVSLSLRDLVDGCMDLLRETAALRPIVLKAEITPEVPLCVEGDPTRLSQVLINLLGNAVKFTKEGTITVSVSVVDSRLRFAVRDPGIGIAREKQSLLFQRFSQTDASTTREFGGTGLGLAICKSLIELMGGDIGVVSEPGLGSLFWFELPLKEIEPQRAAAGADDRPLSAPAGARTLRILMADDVRLNQTIVSAMLEAEGHAVVVVENGAEAVEAARGGGFDLILMDIQMPVLNGYAAARAIRAFGDGVGGVPILALTAAAYREDEERALSAGMNGHLAKPIDNRSLLAAVRRWTETGPADERLTTDTRNLDETTFEELARLLGRDRIIALASLLDLQLTRVLTEVVPSGDPMRLAREAHMLVSSAGSFGLVEVTRHAQAILKVGPTPAALDLGSDLQRAASIAILTLRRRLDALRQAPDAAPVLLNQAGGTRQPCVLMAEDETLVMLNAIDFLGEEGFVIKTAATGEEALRLIELGERFDVLFADVRLPGRFDGLALARRARELRPDLPVLLTSGHVVTIDGHDLPEARFLPKPYSLAQVSVELRALADRNSRPFPHAVPSDRRPEPAEAESADRRLA